MDPLEHLTSLITNVPSWLLILDEQKDQLGRRQAELARISESSQHHHSTTNGTFSRSLRNKGSAESLRPRANTRLEEQDEEAIDSDGNEDGNPVEEIKSENIWSAKTMRSHTHPIPQNPRDSQRKTSSSNKFSLGSAFKSSPSTLPTTYAPPPRLLKRRTSKSSSLHSMHSSNSQTPTHPTRLTRSNRTKSMIMVYYDSFVQQAFENLVRHISTARNAMRKGKMAERMGRMRMLAELEDSSDDNEEEDRADTPTPKNDISENEKKTPEALTISHNTNNLPSTVGLGGGLNLFNGIEAGESEDDDGEVPVKLEFKSTRMMGPNRAMTEAPGLRLSSTNAAGFQRASTGPTTNGLGTGRPPMQQANSTPVLRPGLSSSLLRNNGEDTSIYDDLDSSLEWCQATCESAAHRFLRDGECYNEIAGVKKRLEDLVVKAQTALQKAAEKAKEEEANKKGERGSGNKVRMRGGGSGVVDSRNMMRARQLRSPLMRKPSSPIRTYSDLTGNSLTKEIAATKAHEIDEGLGDEIEADDMEDHESTIEDDPNPPKLVFRSMRSGGMVRR